MKTPSVRPRSQWLALSTAALFASACSKQESPAPEPAPAANEAAASAPGETAKGTGEPPKAAASAAMPQPEAGKVQCLGANACKGQSACHVKDGHACAGQNACKGKGWIMMTQPECEAAGGQKIDS